MSNEGQQNLIDEKCYHGLLPREDMKILLRKNGDYLLRMTEPAPNQPRQYVLSVMVEEGTDLIKHFVVTKIPEDGRFAIDKRRFNTIQELIAYHEKTQEPLNEVCPGGVIKNGIGRQPWELRHDDIESTKKLGEGAFGEVHKGILRRGKKKIDVAIKVAKLEAMTKEQIKELMRESRLMRMLDHPHVIRTLGVAAGTDPIQIVMELASNGALDSYLQKNDVPTEKKTEMCMQAAWGVDYMHSRNVMHRDLAARNCLYGDGKVKISDFGLSREGAFYQMDPKRRVPIRWLAPETLKMQIYSQKTDVYSYGIMCWEIYHNGKEPYPGMTPGEVAGQVRNGYRMEFTSPVPPEVKKMIVENVWVENSNDRWSMNDVCIFYERMFSCKRPEGGRTSSVKPEKEKERVRASSRVTRTKPRGKKKSKEQGNSKDHD